MPEPIPMAIRQSIVERHARGETISSLSRQFQVSRRSVYNLINRHSCEGDSGLRPRYANCGQQRPLESDFLFRAVRCMRAWHPGWGSEKIRAEMQRMRPNLALPHYRTMTRWFHWNGQMEIRLKSKLPQTGTRQATRLHEIWQIDAKEEMRIANGSKNCWLNVTDEYSGGVMDPPVFSL
jgi:hypothetical protein